MDTYKTVTVMLVEDDPGDQKLIKMSLREQRIANAPIVAQSAEEAVEYLNANILGDKQQHLPDLILLDLNMPGMGGKEFLRQIKSVPQLASIPVVILTTSDSDKDILESFKLQAAGYIKKPVSITDFQEVMRTLTDYWFTICRRITHESDRQTSECLNS
ncbi:MAG: response regulator [Phycisphaerae bacterium]|nr:response regulator [Phycisphaerae bacterium]